MLIALILALAVNASTWYAITFQTSSHEFAGGDSDTSVWITGSKGSYYFGKLNNANFRADSTISMSKLGEEEIGDIKCIRLEFRGTDAWLFDWIRVWSSTHGEEIFPNTKSVWMSSETEYRFDAVDEMNLCEGDSAWYTVIVFTGEADHSSTDSKVFVTLHGSDTDVKWELDQPDGFRFSYASTWTFHFGVPSGYIGTMQCITVEMEGGNNWLFHWIRVESGQSEKKVFVNDKKVWLSGEDGLKLCDDAGVTGGL